MGNKFNFGLELKGGQGGDENNDTEYSNIDRMSLYKFTLCPLHSYTFVVLGLRAGAYGP